MKQMKRRRVRRRLDNKGFSLVELLISIAVLVIIMVPLMNNFFRSMQMNKKAEKLQIQSNLAASIMEGLKSSDITGIIIQFIRDARDFDLIPLSETPEAVLRLVYDDETMELEDSSSTDEQDTYYFAINGIRLGGSAYDAFITIDSVDYKDDEVGTMNNYPMPEPINLDEKANGLVFSTGTANGVEETPSLDDLALTNFTTWGRAFAQTKLLQSADYQAYLDSHAVWQDAYVQAVIDGTALPPEPVAPTLDSYAPSHTAYKDYYDPELIKTYITKIMRITVNDKRLTYDLEYQCDWPKGDVELQALGENNVQSSYETSLLTKNYPKAVENVYLFYTPSIFQGPRSDKAVIVNEVSANPVSFYVAKQGAEIIQNKITIQRIGDNLSAYTDLNTMYYTSLVGNTQETTATVNSNVVKSQQKDRIYQVIINICKYEDVAVSDRYDLIDYTLESTLVE